MLTHPFPAVFGGGVIPSSCCKPGCTYTALPPGAWGDISVGIWGDISVGLGATGRGVKK